MSLTIRIEDALSKVLKESAAGDETWLVYDAEYKKGDCIVLESDKIGSHAVIQLDDAMPPALVYLTGSTFRLPIPWGETKKSYSPRSFAGTKHMLHARCIPLKEVTHSKRNLAFNPYDVHGEPSLSPHASANVETRNESVFAARNVIDGSVANTFHGEWPYTSWGINQNPAASLKIEFGRSVQIEKAVLYLRADFPHDAWWKSADLSFSDGSAFSMPLQKTGGAQSVDFSPRAVEWVILEKLIKAEDPSPFPALSQLEIWGIDIT